MKLRKPVRSESALWLMILVGLVSVVFLSRWIDSHRPPVEANVEESRLYVSAAAANRMSLSFKGLMADWYWMRALQYVGRKVIATNESVQLDNMTQLDLKLLAPLLEATTELDPQFMEPYQYAAVVLPSVDVNEAIRIIKKGISSNPSTWSLYHHLGYIYWQQKNFAAAADAYTRGSQLPGAPAWMHVMKARMADEGGSRETARELYRRMYEDAGDQQIKDMARKRLMQLDSFDERDRLRQLMAAYKANTGRCPSAWRDMQPALRAVRARVDDSGAPLDPAGTAYILIKDKCEVELDWKSQIPFK